MFQPCKVQKLFVFLLKLKKKLGGNYCMKRAADHFGINGLKKPVSELKNW